MRRVLALLAVTVLVLAACGDDDADVTTDLPAADPGAENDVDPDDAEPADAVDVALVDTALGAILVDGDGFTLYGFTVDSEGVPTCTGDCADAWPAALVDGEPVVGSGLDPAVFSVVEAVDGGDQLRAGDWPLYRFAGDSAPGDVNGQGVNGVWFVVAADGSLIQDEAGDAGGAGGGAGTQADDDADDRRASDY